MSAETAAQLIKTVAVPSLFEASKMVSAAVTGSRRSAETVMAPGAILPPEDRPDWHNKRAFDAIPMNASGRPSDVVAAVKFLLQSTFITGEILHVDGGEGL